MELSGLSLAAWSYGACLLAFTFLFVHLAGPQTAALRLRSPNAAMLAYVLLTAFWSAGLAFSVLLGSVRVSQFAHFLDVLRYAAILIFMFRLLNTKQALHGVGLLLPLAVLLTTCWLLAELLSFFFPFSTINFVHFSRLTALATIGLALVLLEQLFRNVVPDALWNIKPLVLALSSTFIFDFYLFSESILFNQTSIDTFTVRGFVYLMVMPLLAMASARSHDWGSKIQLSQKAAFHSATLILAGAYLLLVAVVAYYVRHFGGDWGRALQLMLLLLATLLLCLLLVSGSWRARIRVLLRKHFFRYRYDYRDEWLRFTKVLGDHTAADSLFMRVIHGLADLVESPAGCLWLIDTERKGYRQVCVWNMPTQENYEPVESEFCQFMNHGTWIVNIDECKRFPDRYQNLVLPDWLLDMPTAWLLVPLVIEGFMEGFVVLAVARTPIDVNWEVTDLLKTAGSQAASFILQAKATEALMEAKKFDSFNRMSAFVVHDLKNIVTQLALMLKNAERHRHNPEFQDDMLMTVNHSVEKMRQLMLQLREGESASGPSCGVDLSRIIHKIRQAKAVQGRELIVDIKGQHSTRGHEDKLERILDHLVQNAFDATPDAQTVSLTLCRQAGLIKLDIEDHGCGMTDDFVRERLFRPFQSTKKMGMGIGAYECAQYVKELGGKIMVDSEVGRGTIISLYLPPLETA